MRNTRLFTGLTVGCLLPFSLLAQSVTIKAPQPVMNVAAPLPLQLHLPSVFPTSFDNSDRDLPVQEQETIQKSFSMAGVQHRSQLGRPIYATEKTAKFLNDHGIQATMLYK